MGKFAHPMHSKDGYPVADISNPRERRVFEWEFIYVSVEWRAKSGERWLESGKLAIR